MTLAFKTGEFLEMIQLPGIISEWAAVIPLVCHLASPQDDYLIAGDLSLNGRFSIPLFPRLGTLLGLGRLLKNGSKYFDFASVRGGSSRTVWDVKWGSEFPCANGAASVAIEGVILERAKSKNDKLFKRSLPPSKISAAPNIREVPLRKDETTSKKPHFRQQILYVYQYNFHQPHCESLRYSIVRISRSRIWTVLSFIILCGIALIFCLMGAYGTASLILIVTSSRLVGRIITIPRSSGYLRNNEKSENATMLVASHVNASEWTLYTGDRAIIDSLLNKPMISFPEGNRVQLAARFFYVAHGLQLIVITYVAAQKGWDGVTLLCVLCLHYVYRWLAGDQDAAYWLAREGVQVKVRAYEFGWRSVMLGSIQLFSDSKTTRWMDSIIVPHLRRDTFLSHLQGGKIEKEVEAKLDEHDLNWVNQATILSVQSAETLRQDFGLENSRTE